MSVKTVASLLHHDGAINVGEGNDPVVASLPGHILHKAVKENSGKI